MAPPLRPLVLALCPFALAACGEPLPPPPPAQPLAEYRYAIERTNPMLHPGESTLGVTLELDGRNLGEYTKEFTLPRETMVSATKTKLALVVPSTTCGDARVAVEAEFPQRSEAQRRADADEWVAAGGEASAIHFTARIKGEWPATDGWLFVDNSRNKRDTVVRVGSLEVKVAAGTGASPSFAVGTCEGADEITIDGRPVGKLFPWPKVTLVDVMGGSCYVRETVVYAAETAEGVGPPPPIEHIRTPAGGHLVEVSAALFMGKNPESVRVHGTEEQLRQATALSTSLNPIPCAAIR